jgi:hypothetical protein
MNIQGLLACLRSHNEHDLMGYSLFQVRELMFNLAQLERIELMRSEFVREIIRGISSLRQERVNLLKEGLKKSNEIWCPNWESLYKGIQEEGHSSPSPTSRRILTARVPSLWTVRPLHLRLHHHDFLISHVCPECYNRLRGVRREQAIECDGVDKVFWMQQIRGSKFGSNKYGWFDFTSDAEEKIKKIVIPDPIPQWAVDRYNLPPEIPNLSE